MGCVQSQERKDSKESADEFAPVSSKGCKDFSTVRKEVKVKKPANHRTISRCQPAHTVKQVEATFEEAGLETVQEVKETAFASSVPSPPLVLSASVVSSRELFSATSRVSRKKSPTQTPSATCSQGSQEQPQIEPHQHHCGQYYKARPQTRWISDYLSVYNPAYEPFPRASSEDHAAQCYTNTVNAELGDQLQPTPTASTVEASFSQPLLPLVKSRTFEDASVADELEIKYRTPSETISQKLTHFRSRRAPETSLGCETFQETPSRSDLCPLEPETYDRSTQELFDDSAKDLAERGAKTLDLAYDSARALAGVRAGCEVLKLLGGVSRPTHEVRPVHQEGSKGNDLHISQIFVQQNCTARKADSFKILNGESDNQYKASRVSRLSMESDHMDVSRRSKDGYVFMSVDSLEEYGLIAPAPSLQTMWSSFESFQNFDEVSRRSFAVDTVNALPSDSRATDARTPSDTETHSTRPVRKNAKNYQFLEEIGRGSSAVVMRAEVAGEEVAVKVFDIGKESFKSELKNKILSVVSTEEFLLKTIQHSSIIKFRELSTKGTHRYLEMELCKGGDLQADLARRGRYTEDMARALYRQILCALEVLHANKVVHNDIKLENLLLKTNGDKRVVKVVDFGLAHFTDLDSPHKYLVGTREYMSPELVRHCQKDDCTLAESVKPTYSMDMWSAGVVLFHMLGGYNPFHGVSTKHIFRSIVHVDLDLRAPAWQTVSASAKDLISKLLMKNPAERLTAVEALQHPWFGPSCTPQSTHQPALFRGIQRRRFKRAVWAIVALCLLRKKAVLNKMVF